MLPNEIVVYRPGQAIDPHRILQVERLSSRRWGPIRRAYPEVMAAGPNASFQGTRNTTIFPPQVVSKRVLCQLLKTASPDRTIYRREDRGRLLGILVHTHASRGGYDSVHIYRLEAHAIAGLLARKPLPSKVLWCR